jgi:hypothetical protein
MVISYMIYLVGGLEHEWIMTVHSVGNGIIIPTDFQSIIFQRGRYTTNQINMKNPSQTHQLTIINPSKHH